MSDPLAILRAAVAPTGDLTNVSLIGQDGAVVQDIQQAHDIRIQLPQRGPPVTFPKSQPTRLAATLASAQDGTAATSPEGLLPLDALVFAIMTKDETSGSYTRLRAAARVARIELVARSDILDYLTGKRDSYEAVIPAEGEAAAPAAAPAPTVTPADHKAEEAAAEGPSTTPPSSPPLAHTLQYGSHAARTTAPEPTRPTTSAVKRTYVPDNEDIDFVKKLRRDVEVTPRNRNDAAHGTEFWAQTTDFGHFRTAIHDRLEAMRKLVTGKGGPAGPDSRSTAAVPPPAPSSLARRQRAQDPIILLSNSPTALVNMYNVKQLLEDGIFVHPDQAKRDARGVAETVVTLSHTMSFTRPTIPGQAPKPTRFLVVDNVDALNKLAGPARPGVTPDPWSRVAAIFTTGQMWQFKQYKEQDPKKLFQKFLGIYVRYHNEKRQDNIGLWHVREFVVDKNHRHTDKQLAASFWRLIEQVQMRHH